MRCPHCKTTLKDTAAFICPNCGGLLDPMEGEVRRIRWAIIGALALVYSASFALWALSGIAPKWLALAGMILAVACALFTALRLDAKVLGTMGLAGGFLIPLLLDTGSTDPAVLYATMLALNLAGLAMAQVHGWPMVAKAAFGATWVIMGGTYIPMDPGSAMATRLLAIHGLLLAFILWPMVEDLRGIDTIRNRNAFLPPAAGMVALGLAYPLVERNYGLVWCAGLTLAYCAAFFLAAATLYLLGRRRRSSLWSLLTGSGLFLMTTIAIAFSIE